MNGVFDKAFAEVYRYKWDAQIIADRLVGGIPSDPKVIKGWIESKFADQDERIQELIHKTMADRGVEIGEAIQLAAEETNVNGFKFDAAADQLYLEGRQIKACIKEASNIRWPKRREWRPGSTKGTRSFFAEHVFVLEDRVHLGVREPSGPPLQGFVHTFRGSSIKYEDYVDEAKLSFTVVADVKIKEEDWAELWVTAQMQGLGASRSQGFGRFTVVGWDATFHS